MSSWLSFNLLEKGFTLHCLVETKIIITKSNNKNHNHDFTIMIRWNSIEGSWSRYFSWSFLWPSTLCYYMSLNPPRWSLYRVPWAYDTADQVWSSKHQNFGKQPKFGAIFLKWLQFYKFLQFLDESKLVVVQLIKTMLYKNLPLTSNKVHTWF